MLTAVPLCALASTYYVSNSGSDTNSCSQATSSSTPRKTISAGLGCLAPGDALVLRDGTYSGSANSLSNLPNGSSSGYITIKAETDGAVILTGGLAMDHTDAYLQFEGLRFQDDGRTVLGNHLKFFRNEFKGGCSSGNCAATTVGSNDYSDTADILFEDNWFHGLGGRYNVLVYNSDRVVFRRAVIRHDGGWTDTKGDPEAAINFYASSNCSAQNVIVIDSDLTYSSWNAAFYAVKNTSVAHGNDSNSWLGSIALATQGQGLSLDDSGTISNPTIRDCVFWDNRGGGIAMGVGSRNNVSIKNVTIGRSKLSNGSWAGGIGFWGSGSVAISNVIIKNRTTALDGVSATYHDCFGNSSCSSGTGMVTYDPELNGLNYLGRIESGTPLKTAGQSGGQIGATIVNRTGASGTLQGQSGWNTETGEALWPWPLEARIKKEMCTDAGVSRGFCSDSSLTNYFWNYLGRGNPYSGASDTTPPVISGVAGSNVTSNSATVGWSTNEPSDTQVEYGLTTSYGNSTALNTSMTTSHNASLAGLSAQALYHYRVKSRDAAGNLSVSGDYTFTTQAGSDTTPPVLSGIGSSNITSSGASIAWTTNEPSDTQVDYGPTASYGSSSSLDSSLATNHNVSLSGLNPQTLYHYRVKSRDAAGNLAVSGDNTFTTAASGGTGGGGVENIVWSSLVNCTATGNTLKKTSGAGGSSDAGAVSQQTLASGDGYVEFTALETNTNRYAGLSNGNTNTGSGDIDFAVRLAFGTAEVRENGISMAQTTFAANDVFRVAVESGVVKYYKNGVRFYTSTKVPAYPLLVDTSMIDLNATVANAVLSSGSQGTTPLTISSVGAVGITSSAATVTWTTNNSADTQVEYGPTTAYGSSSPLNSTLVTNHSVTLSGLNPLTLYHYRVKSRDAGGNLAVSEDFTFTTATSGGNGTAQNVVWTSLVRCTATGNTLKKTSGTDGIANAGAISQQSIASGDGHVEFTAVEVNKNRYAGLSNGNSNNRSGDIDFAIRLAYGSAEIRENGYLKTNITFAANDVFRVAVESGVVKYYKNGVLFYTSSKTPKYPLLVDTSMVDLNSTVADTVLSGADLSTTAPATSGAPAVSQVAAMVVDGFTEINGWEESPEIRMSVTSLNDIPLYSVQALFDDEDSQSEPLDMTVADGTTDVYRLTVPAAFTAHRSGPLAFQTQVTDEDGDLHTEDHAVQIVNSADLRLDEFGRAVLSDRLAANGCPMLDLGNLSAEDRPSKVIIRQPDGRTVPPPSNEKEIDIARHGPRPVAVYSVSTDGTSLLVFRKPVTLVLTYRDADDNGIVDGTNIDASRLRVFFHDKMRWRLAGGLVDKTQRTVTVRTSQMSLFALFPASDAAFEVSAENVKSQQRFLTPALANGAQSVMTFGLQAQKIEILDEAGNEVYKAAGDGSSALVWNGRDRHGKVVESGVYVVKITDTAGVRHNQTVAVVK
ncbi:MAG: fibronectin type III domain-containing protein [Elusimicrobia bacterium]|nr:fibronectin type III domain-containing protein [Elusimicrobiota bacterium]